ncbi:hypothetical protein Tco_1204789 [Tanacetum coccineum]
MAGFGSSSGISGRALNELMDLSGKTEGLLGKAACYELGDFEGMEFDSFGSKDVMVKTGRQSLCLIFYSMATFEILDQLTEVADSSHLQDRMKVWFIQACTEDKGFFGFLRDRCAGLRMTLSKNCRLIAELEALGERMDAVRCLDHMREIVARDSGKLGSRLDRESVVVEMEKVADAIVDMAIHVSFRLLLSVFEFYSSVHRCTFQHWFVANFLSKLVVRVLISLALEDDPWSTDSHVGTVDRISLTSCEVFGISAASEDEFVGVGAVSAVVVDAVGV